MLDQPGGIFVRGIELVPEEDRLLMLAIARLVISDRRGNCRQVGRGPVASRNAPGSCRRKTRLAAAEMQLPPRCCSSTAGGFTPDGREYVVLLPPGRALRALGQRARQSGFGSVVTETGSAYLGGKRP